MEFLYMTKPFSSKLHFTLLLLINITLLSACHSGDLSKENRLSTSVNLSDAPLEINILETGKSDCIVIKVEDKTVMIDTGLDQNGEKIADFLEKEQIDVIDYLIISHLDKDHIGGAETILDEVAVSKVIQPNYTRDTKQYKQYTEALKDHELNPIYLANDMTFKLNDATFIISPPLQEEYELSNDYSLITSVSYGNQSFLFAGDAESIRLSEFLATSPLHYTLLKLPHHGRYSEKLDELLTAISPTYGIITCSEEEYADTEVLELLAKHHVQTLMTSDGPIVIRSDGKNISVHQQLKTIISFKQKGD